MKHTIQNRQSEIGNWHLIDAFDDARLETREGADVAHAVPRIEITGRFALGFVAFQKPGMKNSFVSVVKRTRPVSPYPTIRSG